MAGLHRIRRDRQSSCNNHIREGKWGLCEYWGGVCMWGRILGNRDIYISIIITAHPHKLVQMATSKVTIYRNQVPARGVRVSFEYTGFFQNGFTSDYYTNDDGVAFIEHESKGNARVYINGREMGKMKTPGMESYNL